MLKVDRFGNLVTNIPVDEFPDLLTRPFEISVGLQRVQRLCSAYADAIEGELFAIAGSSGLIEISVNQGSAAARLGCGAGAPVELTFF